NPRLGGNLGARKKLLGYNLSIMAHIRVFFTKSLISFRKEDSSSFNHHEFKIMEASLKKHVEKCKIMDIMQLIICKIMEI
ncbi:MAG: hypothetical protein PUB87_05470, partial [Eubacteriaceae bacterium]|nr:hypothetical protein [Eubacteriaceae bacterium]